MYRQAPLFLISILFLIIGRAQVTQVLPASNVWQVAPDSAESFGYQVELLSRALPTLRVEFPASINEGYEYGYTSVQLTAADENTVLLRVQAYDAPGPGRKFITLSGSEEWLACLQFNSSFHKPDPTQPFTVDTGAYWYVDVDVDSFLGGISCAFASPEQ